jgi:hypothetical protein
VEAGGGRVQAGGGWRLLACEEEIVREGPSASMARVAVCTCTHRMGNRACRPNGISMKRVPIISIKNKGQEKKTEETLLPLLLGIDLVHVFNIKHVSEKHKTCQARLHRVT